MFMCIDRDITSIISSPLCQFPLQFTREPQHMMKASEHSDVHMFAKVLQFNINFIYIALYTINWFKVNNFASFKNSITTLISTTDQFSTMFPSHRR